MRTYNKSEALLVAWKRKIENVKTLRILLKKKLVDICEREQQDVTRENDFKELRNKLLSDNHGEGWTWTANFDWFWNFIFYFVPASWKNPQSGSRLRKVLAEEPEIAEFQLLSQRNFDDDIDTGTLLDDKAFEDALFSNPLKAMIDLKKRFSEINCQSSACLLERVYALKFRMDANLYHHLLEKLYDHFPIPSITYFYNIYNLEQYETLTPQDFTEVHLMARALLDKFVTIHSNVATRQYNIQYILAILCFNANFNKSSFSVKMKSLFQRTKLEEDLLPNLFSDNEAENILSRLYETLTTKIRETLDFYLGKTEISNREANRLSTIGQELDAPSLPLQVLTDIFTKLEPSKHPLLDLFARQSCELLLLDYKKQPKMELGTIKFICDKILGTWSKPNEESLNPMGHVPTIPDADGLKRAEKNAIHIILHDMNKNEVLDKTRRIRMNKTAILDKARSIRIEETKWEPVNTEWVFSRLKHHYKNKYDLLPELKHILVDTIFYSPKDIVALSRLTTSPASVEQLFDVIQQNITKANQALTILNSSIQNNAARDAVSAFQQCLLNPLLTSANLQKLVNEFLPQLSEHYITSELKNMWTNKIGELQGDLLARATTKALLFQKSPRINSTLFASSTSTPNPQNNELSNELENKRLAQ